MTITPKLILGKFMQDGSGTLHGKIGGLGLVPTSVVSESATSQGGKSYLKLFGDPLGSCFEIGAAFPKEKDGVTYYSVNLESPIFPAPINGILYPDKHETNTLNLLWSRPEQPKTSIEQITEASRQVKRNVGASATMSP